MRIDAAGPADRDDWLLLWRHYQTALSAEVDEHTWRRIVDPSSPVGCRIARWRTGAAIGLANYVLRPSTWSCEPICLLQDLFVLPSARGKGVGGALVSSLVAEGRAKRWASIEVVTAAENEIARRLYQRFGTEKVGVRYELPMGPPSTRLEG